MLGKEGERKWWMREMVEARKEGEGGIGGERHKGERE